MFDFQKLEVYKKDKLFYSDCIIIIESSDLGRTPSNQLSRASFSIVLNMAEGSGRFGKKDVTFL